MTTLSKINTFSVYRPKILLAPLDWGLGHATRCIPIIKELINLKCEIWIAASGAQKALLKEEFPLIRFVELPGYNVKYGNNRAFTLLKIFATIPKILIRIKREKDWLRRFLATEKPDAVISDNRYGLYAPGLISVFITHQLRIKTPFGSWADTLLQQIHYRAIRPFSFCWVPDLEGSPSLAGDLSHPRKLPSIPTRYIGLLSRFERSGFPGMGMTGPLPALSCDLLVLLSGPEPQRTIFERKVLDQLATYSGSAILVRGLPGAGLKASLATEGTGGYADKSIGKDTGKGDQRLQMPVPPGVRVYNHLPAGALNRIINEAGIVLSRAGYSTIMDLLKLGKKAILVPTPGQTEQEYLGQYLSEKGIALCRKQAGFSLSEALSGARAFPFAVFNKEGEGSVAYAKGENNGQAVGLKPTLEADLLQKALRSFLQSLVIPS